MTLTAQDSIARLLRLNVMNLRLNGDRSTVLAPGRLVEIGDEKIMKPDMALIRNWIFIKPPLQTQSPLRPPFLTTRLCLTAAPQEAQAEGRVSSRRMSRIGLHYSIAAWS